MDRSAAAARIGWLDRLKGLALGWIFLNHAVEQLFGGGSFGNPGQGWPTLRRRIEELAPADGSLSSWLWALFRDFGWLGDQGVGLFLLGSGFGLAWGLLQAADAPRWGDFYRRRLFRIYPLWWGAHLYVLALLLLGKAEGGALEFVQSLLGLRIDAASMYRYAAAWWFVGLLIQLYLVFPLLWKAMARWGGWRLLVVSAVLAAALRGLGMACLHEWMDPFLRGAVFLTRLPEFVLGMFLAEALKGDPAALDARLRSPGGRIAAAGLWLSGTACSFTWPGMTLAPLLTTAGAFGVLYPWLARVPTWNALGWVGVHSYAFFLVHHSMLHRTVHAPATAGMLPRILLAAALTVVFGLALERGVARVESWLGSWKRRASGRRMALQAAAAGAVVVLLLLGAELLTRRLDPLENEGWGERPSLERDEEFGWKLRPSRTTRLRWESYDYTVSANALGFPGPLPPEARTPGSLRILVTGDAFSSAEGVDTDKAWPRLLETRLRESLGGRPVEVLNFAITGYGPNQYAAVLKRFIPRFKPDLVVVESYLNDFDDATLPTELFQEMIGFSRRDPDGLRSILRLGNLRNWGRSRLLRPLKHRLKGEPDPEGLGFAGIPHLERGPEGPGAEILRARFAEILEACKASGARLLVAIVPASAQVCRPDQLTYWPRGVDLSDSARYDLERPQKRMVAVMDGLGIPTLDLRPALRACSESPCQPRNLHWTEAGHRAVADELVRTLRAGTWISPSPR